MFWWDRAPPTPSKQITATKNRALRALAQIFHALLKAKKLIIQYYSVG
jgi:hypothetical protein